jgi:CDP-diacylglycerol---glycerol-3-phosphate 3-phosphatidyltransferase
MNLPNKLTLLRIIMIPVFVVIFYIPVLQDEVTIFNYDLTLANLVGVIVFAVAAFTDFLDGNIARKYNLVTTFGKFMDPLADKLLVMSALLISIEFNLMPAFVPIIILAREFMVTGIRTLAISEGKVIAASNLGKLKTVSQMVMIIVLLVLDVKKDMIFTNFSGVSIITDVLITIATLLTLISGYEYFSKNKHIIFASK